MKKMMTLLLLPYLLFAANISGYLRDAANGEALNGGYVLLEDTKSGSTTNADGYFVITNVSAGKHKLVAKYIGYKTYAQDITILSTQNLKLNIKLESQDQELAAINVEAERETQKEVVRDIRVSQMKVNTRELKTTSTFVMPDLFRAIKTLPGVASPSDFSTGLYVRGGNDDHNLILYDDITVYNPSHLFGLFSTFMPEALRDVKLTKSAYPAEYDGRLGAVLDVRSKDGNKEKFEGSVSASLFATEAILSGPVSDGGFLVAARRTHLEPVLEALDYPGYFFWEGQGQIYQDYNEGSDRVLLSSYIGDDKLNWDDIGLKLNWGNRTFSTRWRHVFSPQLYSTFKVASSNFFVDNSLSDKLKGENEIQDYSAKAIFEYFASSDLTYKSGLEYKFFNCRYETNYEDKVLMKIDQNSNQFSTFFDVSKTWLSVFTLNPGIRVNYSEEVADDYKFTVSPRLSMKYMIDEDNALTLSGGRYYQNLFTVQNGNSAMSFVNQWFNIDKSVKPGISNNAVLGWENNTKIFGDDYKFTAEVYYKTMENLLNYKETRAGNNESIINPTIDSIFVQYDATAWGIELFAEKTVGKLNGSISYTYSVSNQDREADKYGEVPVFWHVPHNFKTSLTYNFNKNFNIGTTINYSSGRPYTEVIGFYTQTEPNGNETPVQINGKTFAARYPDYFRVDVAANYTWFFKNNSSLLLNGSVINVFDRKNVQTYYYNKTADDYMERKIFGMLPIIPSIRLSYNF